MWLLFISCGAEPGLDRIEHERALTLLTEAPAAAAARCDAIREERLRADCAWAAAAALATQDPARAEALCNGLETWARDECWFSIAEATGTAGACAHAGRFETDCRAHLFDSRIASWMTPELEASDVETRARVPVVPGRPGRSTVPDVVSPSRTSGAGTRR